MKFFEPTLPDTFAGKPIVLLSPMPSQCCFARWHRHIGRGNGSNENHNVALETCPDKLCLGDLAEMFWHSNFITQLKILESWWNAISLRDQNDVE